MERKARAEAAVFLEAEKADLAVTGEEAPLGLNMVHLLEKADLGMAEKALEGSAAGAASIDKRFFASFAG